MTDNSSNSSRTKIWRLKHKVSKQWVMFSGDCSQFKKYLASKSYNSCFAPVKFLDALFRGYGQVVFANNPISGVLIFSALTVAAPQVSGAGLFTACIGLLTSIMVIPQSEEIISNGLTAYNPLLIGLITVTAIHQQYSTELKYWQFFMIIASIFCVYMTSALANILDAISEYPLPCLTLPFNVVQQLLFLTLASASMVTNSPPVLNVTSQSKFVTPGSLEGTNKIIMAPIEKYIGKNGSEEMFKLSSHTTPTGVYVALVSTQTSDISKLSQEEITSEYYTQYLTFNDTMNSDVTRIEKSGDDNSTSRDNDNQVDWSGVFSGIVLSASQVYASNYTPTAVLIYLAILIYSPISAAFALLGSTISTLTGVFLMNPTTYSAPGGAYDGSWGFNGLLCSIGLGLFFVLSWSSAVTAIFSAVFASVLQYLYMSLFPQASLGPMTLPFNLSALLFLCVTSQSLVRPKIISFPEKHSLEYKQYKLSQEMENTNLTHM